MALLRLTALGIVVLGHHLDDERAAGRVVEGDGDAADEGDGVDRDHRRIAAERERGRARTTAPWRRSARSAAAGACRSGRRSGRPTAPSTSTGPNWAAASSPRAMPLSVRCSTSSVWATSVIQLPTCEMSWPPKKRRKLRTCSDRKVSRVGDAERRHGRPSCVARSSRTSRASARRRRWSRSSSSRRSASQAFLRWRSSASRASPASVVTHARDAAVVGVGLAEHEAVGLELGDDPGDGGGGDPLVLGQRAEGERAVAVDGGEGRELAGREAGVGLLAEPAGQAGGAQAQAGSDFDVVHAR